MLHIVVHVYCEAPPPKKKKLDSEPFYFFLHAAFLQLLSEPEPPSVTKYVDTKKGIWLVSLRCDYHGTDTQLRVRTNKRGRMVENKEWSGLWCTLACEKDVRCKNIQVGVDVFYRDMKTDGYGTVCICLNSTIIIVSMKNMCILKFHFFSGYKVIFLFNQRKRTSRRHICCDCNFR